MLLLVYLLVATLLNLVLGFLVQFKSYRGSLRLALLGLSALFTLYLWTGRYAVLSRDVGDWFLMQKALISMGLAASLGILELSRGFLRSGEQDSVWSWGRWRPTPIWLAGIGAAVGAILPFVPGQVMLAGEPGDFAVVLQGFGLLVPAIQVLIGVYTLYLLETTYRFSRDFQRRIGRLCFIGLGLLTLFQVCYFARVLLFQSLPIHFVEATSVVYGVVYPVVLVGFLRYRLGAERIMIPRDTVYTSATVFLAGAAFLGVALTVFAFRWFKVDFSYFERFLVAFSLCFLAVLVLGSGTMRRHITRFVDQQLYSRKYDYQEQFFRLHRTMITGADVESALTELVENMKYSVTVGDAYFFMLNWQDGNFYQHENKEEASRRGLVINGDSPLARHLTREKLPVDLLEVREAGREARELMAAEPLLKELRIDAVFPVFIAERLVGMLALLGGRRRPFDSEDLALIAVFTNSIGDVLFKNRVLKERIEQKQFESFHHVASFIIHDIKNQIATLSLLLKNAERNLGNPSFQASMLSSVKSCAVNLQSLIDRLSVAPKSQAMEMSLHELRPLLDEVAANSGIASLSGIDFELQGEDGEPVPMDRQGLFFVIRNLVNNALEAMNGHEARDGGYRLAITYGPLGQSAPSRLRELFGGGDIFFAGYGAFITVEDSGAGMDKEFVRRRLFQPFATTKEKGVGIGLYQCKTLVEKMGGRILCHSVLGQGTEFCILLPAKPS